MFFERFRVEVGKYADGVHALGDAADARAIAQAEARLGRPLPKPLAELYRSWNGLELFAGSFVIAPLDGVTAEGDVLRVGEALGAPLVVDEAGRLYEVDEAGDRLLTGTTPEAWLTATMAREGLLVDREGEWKDVFAGEDLRPEVQRKRTRAALKADPGAAAWQLEAAELAFDDGEDAEAQAALERAVAADPGAGAALELLAGLHRRAGRVDEAERAYARAAAATRDPGRRAERLAEAARCAREAGREAERAGYAREVPAEVAVAWAKDAAERLAAGDVDGAFNLATLAQAVASTPEIDQVAQKVRMRRALTVVK